MAGGVIAGLTVGATENEVADEFFDGPTFSNEAGGEMIEQCGVAGTISEYAEVIGRADDALAEQVKPDPIHQDAGWLGVGGVSQPLGQLKTATCGGGDGEIEVTKGRGLEEATRDFGAKLFGFTSNV